MMIYNQGAASDGPFRLYCYPRSARALRGWLAGSRFRSFAPKFAG
jgi:hypothetical protein